MLDGLNSEQEAAVRALRGPVLIGAGAGSGKTRTLTERLVHAMADAPDDRWPAASVEEILAITFTEKAAGELAERVRSTLRREGRRKDARRVDSAWISTIHGFCSRVLRRYAIEAGIDPDFAVADTTEAGRLKEHAFEHAAESALDTPEGRTLFGAYEFGAVFEAVERIAGELRTRGLSAAGLVVEESAAAAAIHREAMAEFASAAEEIEASGADSGTARSLLERARRVAGELSSLDAGAMDETDLAREVWQALDGWTAGRSAGAAEEARQRLIQAYGRLLQEAAACVARPYASALIALVGEYEHRYDRAKADRSLLDFDDLQMRAAQLFDDRPDVVAVLREAFRLVMVDEFQDTDALQLAIVNAVSEENLCTVGDEQQSVYRFRGADIEVYRRHNASMMERGARSFELAFNYRSHSGILDFANEVFSHELFFHDRLILLRHGRDERLERPMPAHEPRVDLLMVHSGGLSAGATRKAEAAAVALRLARLRDEFGFEPGEMVVLMGARTHSDAYATALKAQGFDVTVTGGGRFLELPEISIARCLVSVIANPSDDAALAQLLASDVGRVSDLALWRLSHSDDGTRRGETLWETLRGGAAGLGGADAERVAALLRAVESARMRMGRSPLSEVILRALEDVDADLLYLSQGDRGRQAFANLLKFARLATEYETGGGAGAAGFSGHLDARLRFGDRIPPAAVVGEGARAVRIMSIHESKGLEFPVVAVVETGASRHANPNMFRIEKAGEGPVTLALRPPVAGRCKSENARSAVFRRLDDEDKAAEDEEELRRFYVACTRAREVLIVSGAGNLDKPAHDVALTTLGRVRIALGSALTEVLPGAGSKDVQAGHARLRAEAVMIPEAEASEAGATTPERNPGTCPNTRVSEGQPEPSRRPVAASVTETGAGSDVEQRASEPVVPDRLSYSDLALYARCPLRFYAERVLRVGKARASGRDSAVRLGSAVHAALQLSAEGSSPPAERIDAIGRFFELDDDAKAGLAGAVSAFLASPTASELKAKELVFREWGFAVKLERGRLAVDLVGAIDAYGRTGGTGLVVDYKTGESGDEAALRERYELQARCYALVALRDGCEVVDVVFSRPQVVDARGSMQEVRFRFSSEDTDALEETILGFYRSMAAGEYDARERWENEVCAGCAIAGSVCPNPQPGRTKS